VWEDISLSFRSSIRRVVLNCPSEEASEKTSCKREYPTQIRSTIVEVRARTSNSMYLKELEYNLACPNTTGVWVYGYPHALKKLKLRRKLKYKMRVDL
jgi:hypothetical protein